MMLMHTPEGTLVDMDFARQWTGRPESTIRRHCKPVKKHDQRNINLYNVDDVTKLAQLRKHRPHRRNLTKNTS